MSYQTVAARLSRLTPVLTVVMLLFCSLGSSARGQDTLAILVGVQDYDNVQKLTHINNDVEQLADVLASHGDGTGHLVRRLIAPTMGRAIDREFLHGAISNLLKHSGNIETVLFYFSGHGFQSKDGKLYLCPSDIDPRSPETTGLSLEWVKDQINANGAKNKILILDCCHAGAAQRGLAPLKMGYWEPPVGQAAGDQGSITLASCKSEQTSLVWPEKRQSMFSYWMVKGMSGFADDNQDGEIDFDELYRFVSHNVKLSAKQQFGHPQEPVRHIGTKIFGSPIVGRFRPQSIHGYIAESSELFLQKMKDWKLNYIAAVELQDGSRFQPVLNGNFGILGRKSAEWYSDAIAQIAPEAMIPSRQISSFLAKQKMDIDSLGDSELIQALSEKFNGNVALLTGKFTRRQGKRLVMDMELLAPRPEGGPLRSFKLKGVVDLTPDEWSMLGESVDASQLAAMPNPPDTTNLDAESRRQTHPLLDPRFPFPMRIEVQNGTGWEKRPFEFTDNGQECIVRFRKGEVFRIRVGNKSGSTTMMKLLVDGLDTLPHRTDLGERLTEVAKPVSFSDARNHILDPSTLPAGYDSWSVNGFATGVGSDAIVKDFKVLDVADSWAARQQFTDQVGLISAQFGNVATKRRSIGIGSGNDRRVNLETRSGLQFGEIQAVVHIRYEAMKR